MKLTVTLVDAFEDVEVEVPEQVVLFFTREAAAKKVTIPELLSGKTAGLTVEQMRAVRAHGEDVPRYVMRWIIAQRHDCPIVPD